MLLPVRPKASARGEGKSGCTKINLMEEADAGVIEAAPMVSSNHRIYERARVDPSRAKHASPKLVAVGKANPGKLDYDRAMKQRPPKPTVDPQEEAISQWHVEPR